MEFVRKERQLFVQLLRFTVQYSSIIILDRPEVSDRLWLFLDPGHSLCGLHRISSKKVSYAGEAVKLGELVQLRLHLSTC